MRRDICHYRDDFYFYFIYITKGTFRKIDEVVHLN